MSPNFTRSCSAGGFHSIIEKKYPGAECVWCGGGAAAKFVSADEARGDTHTASSHPPSQERMMTEKMTAFRYSSLRMMLADFQIEGKFASLSDRLKRDVRY